MSFLPDWYSQGTQGQDNNGGFGTANMFNAPKPEQQGNFGGMGDKIAKLVQALRGPSQTPGQMPMSPNNPMQPQSNQMPQYTPMQGSPIGPNMGQVNKQAPMMSPNGQPMPNWSNFYGSNQ